MLCKASTARGKACRNVPVDDTGYCRKHTPDASLHPSDGMGFEEKVANILRILGYSVQRNVSINNCQIDLYAEHAKGVIPHRLMVECKDYGGSRLIGNQEIMKFAGALAIARGQGLVHQGLFITTNGFTADAKALARQSGIELATYAALSTQLVNFDAYIDRVISDFDQLSVSKYYIDLSGTETEDYEGATDARYYRPIDQYIDRCFYQDGQAKLALLGNFGTGKSTFCRKYARDLAQQYKKEKVGRIPVVISLKDYDSKIFIHELILNILQNRYGVSITKSTFYELQRLGKFIFLFDGFDEMDARANPETISANLRELDKISDIKENKFILTCRTHFFRNKVQVEVLEDFGMLYIPEWSETELKEFLQKKFGRKWEEYLVRISGTHNLPELAQTPLFLEMIAETLPALGDHVKRIELYTVYTDKWIRNQTKHKGAVLSAEERRAFIKELAIKLYSENRLSCHYSELLGILKLYLQRIQDKGSRFIAEDAAQLDHLRHDVQTCTFLVRNASGDYSFRHTSFLEFFVAQTLAEALRQGDTTGLEKNILPVTIRGFLVDFLKENPPREAIIHALKNAEGEILRDNIAMLASLLKINLDKVRPLSVRDNEDLLFTEFMKGNTEALSGVYNKYYSTLYYYCIKTIGSSSEVAQEIVLDAFLKLWEKRDAIESLGGVRDYLFTLVKRGCIDYLKGRRDQEGPVNSLVETPTEYGIAEKALDDSQMLSLNEAIKQLPLKQQAVINMISEGYTPSEIGKKLGLSRVHVHRLRSQALESLKKIMKGKNRREGK